MEKKGTVHKNEYLSACNFIHLYNLAAALNARYSGKPDIPHGEQEAMFDKLSLEYKLSNIGQAKAFDKYLNDIGMFYTDKEVDFEMVESFSNEDAEKIGPSEHERWVREHRAMAGFTELRPTSPSARTNESIPI